jgi:hypothetical protein
MSLNVRKQISLIAIVFITIFSFFILNKEPKWLIYDNWKKIETGMDEHLVERHLGKAIDVDYSASTFLYNATYRALQDPENAKAKIYSRYMYYIKDDVGTDFNWEEDRLESYGVVWAKEGKVYFFHGFVNDATKPRFSISGGLKDL